MTLSSFLPWPGVIIFKKALLSQILMMLPRLLIPVPLMTLLQLRVTSWSISVTRSDVVNWTQTKYFATKCRHWREQNPTHNLITLRGVHGLELKDSRTYSLCTNLSYNYDKGTLTPEGSTKNLKRKFTSP